MLEDSPTKKNQDYILNSSFDDEFKKNKIKISQQEMKEKKYSAVEKKPRSSSKPHSDPPVSSSGGTHMVKKTAASKSAT